MEMLKFIILTWLTSFVPAAYCQMGNSSSDLICNITIFKEDSTYPGAVIDVWQSKMIDRCLENYTEEDVITSCERLNNLKSADPDLYIPITNNITNITYTNKYCGYCNNDNETNWKWSYWNSWAMFRFLKDPCSKYTSKIKASEVNDLDKWTETFLSDGMILETTSYLRKLQCSGKENWSINLIKVVIPCLVENYLYGQYDRLISCQYYEKNGRSCTHMEFLIDGYSFQYREKNKFYRHLSEINLTGGDYVVETQKDDVFYMCRQIYHAAYWGKLVRIGISIVSLFIYLFVNFEKQYFDIFSNQLLYIYSIGLIVMCVLLTYIYLQFPVSDVSFNVAKIFWGYHSFWTMLIFIVFCNTALCMCNRSESIAEGNTNGYYSVFIFVFGLMIPFSLPIMYLRHLETNENQCPSIPGHLAMPDDRSQILWFFEFILDPNLAFLMPTIFVVGIFCILLDVSRDSDARNTMNSPVTLLKMELIMGIHWVLYKLCLGYYGNENSYAIIGLSINMDTIAQWSIDIHGVLVFFVLLNDNSINCILNKFGYRRGNTIQQNSYGATETTVRYQF